jgi:hypothetical protein
MTARQQLEALRHRQRLAQAEFDRKVTRLYESHKVRMRKMFEKELPLIKLINREESQDASDKGDK